MSNACANRVHRLHLRELGAAIERRDADRAAGTLVSMIDMFVDDYRERRAPRYKHLKLTAATTKLASTGGSISCGIGGLYVSPLVGLAMGLTFQLASSSAVWITGRAAKRARAEQKARDGDLVQLPTRFTPLAA